MIAFSLLSLRRENKRIERNTREHRGNTGICKGVQENTEEDKGGYMTKHKEECREAQGI